MPGTTADGGRGSAPAKPAATCTRLARTSAWRQPIITANCAVLERGRCGGSVVAGIATGTDTGMAARFGVFIDMLIGVSFVRRPRCEAAHIVTNLGFTAIGRRSPWASSKSLEPSTRPPESSEMWTPSRSVRHRVTHQRTSHVPGDSRRGGPPRSRRSWSHRFSAIVQLSDGRCWGRLVRQAPATTSVTPTTMATADFQVGKESPLNASPTHISAPRRPLQVRETGTYTGVFLLDTVVTRNGVSVGEPTPCGVSASDSGIHHAVTRTRTLRSVHVLAFAGTSATRRPTSGSAHRHRDSGRHRPLGRGVEGIRDTSGGCLARRCRARTNPWHCGGSKAAAPFRLRVRPRSGDTA